MSRPRDRLGRPLPAGSPDELRGEDPAALPNAAAVRARALALFEAERYFEAHEFFEHLWKRPDQDEPERRLWRALAQAAVGLCHQQRGNAAGAIAVLERAARELARHPARDGVDPAALAARLRRVADALARGRQGQG